VQSQAIFLATVNGMPKDILKMMQKNMKDFLWDGRKKRYLPWTDIMASRSEGGLNIPDMKVRTDAIQIMWLKKFLALKEKKAILSLCSRSNNF
jgi:hypothetical protein